MRVRSFYLYAPEPFHPLADTYPQKKTAEEAVQVIQSGVANKHLPRTIGDGMIHQSHLDTIVDCEFRIPELSISKPSQEEKKIGRLIANNLVEDGATLQMGSGVVTTRAHVHYIVTEYGIAYLFGKNMRQRAFELIKIAHPDHRERLEKEAYKIMRTEESESDNSNIKIVHDASDDEKCDLISKFVLKKSRNTGGKLICKIENTGRLIIFDMDQKSYDELTNSDRYYKKFNTVLTQDFSDDKEIKPGGNFTFTYRVPSAT
ncbi:unnamed protein product [Mytilus coruscus]|uniref:Acetyl-CoA hydrolase/transferase C-terminal domain-containing protein n=1 Tax=Mytilus coruscus TaxID=42192 RepID=A0A6J8D351_MYTCO|nr:unnamed protein product [Mytilus coruscus]